MNKPNKSIQADTDKDDELLEMNEDDTEDGYEEYLMSSLYDYIEECRAVESPKTGGKFPNLAGFCRHLGLGLDEFEDSLRDSPHVYGAICAVFEDEALNSPLSATVITAYLKRRLGYAQKAETKQTSFDLSEVKLVFDHDVFEDGG